MPVVSQPDPRFAPRSVHQAQWLDWLQTHRAIAVIRTADLTQGVAMAERLAQAGLRLIEITWNSDRPADLVQTLQERLPHCRIGVGTILSQTELADAIAAGAEYGFCPHTDPDLIRYANAHHLPITPGALTPNEIVAAWQAGADTVKVFPVQALGGASYIQSLQGPLGQIPLIPTGGVKMADAIAYLQAGAIAVGLAQSLLGQLEDISGGEPQGIQAFVTQMAGFGH
jgi:2-dehydro-3-deoxyphosphogluconate aldolase / (4S)-4-hydroxy-2-oxoglutarate aldolase